MVGIKCVVVVVLQLFCRSRNKGMSSESAGAERKLLSLHGVCGCLFCTVWGYDLTLVQIKVALLDSQGNQWEESELLSIVQE